VRLSSVIAVVSLTGCVQLTDFDPEGTSASIEGRWSIDGETPDGFECGRLGADRIRVSFVDEQRPVPHSGLFFRCDVTRPSSDEPGFDTRDASGAVVAAGCWTIRLGALDDSGTVIAVGPTAQYAVAGEDVDLSSCPVAPTDHIVLPATDFLSGRVVAATTLAGSRASEMRCESEGIDEVRIVFDDVGGGRVDALGEIGVSQVPQPCALGRVGARVMPGFTYTAHLEAVDAAGAVRQGASQTFEVSAAGTLCYFGGTCREPCNDAGDCQMGQSCTDGLCLVERDPSVPEVALDAL